jgi:mannose-1-phosphate guanylyltransferase
MAEALKGGDDEALVRHFETIESTSIDFALMEKARNVLAVKADFPWADVGAWNSLAEPDTLNSENNFCLGEPIVIDCANTIVYNEQGADKMAVGVVGMQDVIVVATADAVLVLPRDRAQDVRAVVEELKRRNGPQL